ncbi:hypothetical protein BV22DRAFT_969606, partial [Leucogyrophana mollusca]
VQTIYDEYILNEIPTHLLHVPTMKLMGRYEVKTHFQPILAKIDREWRTEERYDIRRVVRWRAKYAIFSHRWLEAGEPTFQDVSAGRMSGPGYEKLKKFCKKATEEFGCDFVWSDTCCINKESNTEQDEAIRSMFRWYQNSRVCIAYLAGSSTIADFANEEWFRRGWTLQEFLAPQRMKFYGKGWIPFSRDTYDKDSHTENGDSAVLVAMSSTTGIPIGDLLHFEPGTDRVAEKMSWASTRHTTRIEDVAYSLIGIFNVSLTTAYGEGDKAFYNLLKAIMQESNTLDIFFW